MRLLTLFILLSLSGLQSCSSEDPIEKEQRLLKEQLEGFKTEIYKTVKVALRCSKEASENEELAKARNSILAYGITVLERVVPATQNTYDSAIDTPSIIDLSKAAWNAKDVLLEHDEDEFPTVMANIIWMWYNGQPPPQPPYFHEIYNNNVEHVLFGGLWAASPKIPTDFALYELSRVNDNELTLPETIIISKLGRALSLYKAEYFWLSEHNATEYLTYLESNKESILKNERLANYIVHSNSTIKGAHYYEMHAMGALMRSLPRREIGKEEESMEDLEMFLEDAERSGMDNEVVWMVGTYVSISKEDSEKAIKYLTKLESSALLTDVERQSITDVKEYLKTREKGDWLNALNDKVAFVTITVRLMKNELARSKYAQELQRSESGKKFMELKGQLENGLSSLNATDSLSNKASELVKNVFN